MINERDTLNDVNIQLKSRAQNVTQIEQIKIEDETRIKEVIWHDEGDLLNLNKEAKDDQSKKTGTWMKTGHEKDEVLNKKSKGVVANDANETSDANDNKETHKSSNSDREESGFLKKAVKKPKFQLYKRKHIK